MAETVIAAPEKMPAPRLAEMTPALGSTLAQIGIANVCQEYPNKLDHVMNSASDVRSPRSLHPVFYGSYDWHSSVHMHWLLVRLLRLDLDLAETESIHATLDNHFAKENVAIELAYLSGPSSSSFERTYGWAWLLKLQTELALLADDMPHAESWCDALQPLSDAFVDRYLQFLPRARYPIRAGTHANSAFGLNFALEYACHYGHAKLHDSVKTKALEWFARDQRYPANYEPGGDDFLSGGLMEAALMARVLDRSRFLEWWSSFWPSKRLPSAWLDPVEAGDRSDSKLVHLDGLNLSRAWCWRKILPCLPSNHRTLAKTATNAHLEAGLKHATNGDYVGTHWLASFALLALTEH